MPVDQLAEHVTRPVDQRQALIESCKNTSSRVVSSELWPGILIQTQFTMSAGREKSYFVYQLDEQV